MENFNQTDKSLKEVVSGEIGANLVEQLAKKYDVDSDYFSDLMMLLSLFVSKSINTQEFVNEISVFVPQKYFSQFLQELEDKLWSPYDVYLNKAGVVYKQLTKLTPQKLANGEDQIANGQEQKVSVSKPVNPLISNQQSVIELPVTELPKAPEQPITQLPSVTELPIPPASKPIIISAPGIKQEVQIPTPPTFAQDSGAARVKFDAPRVGPQIFKPTESAITPKASEVKFVGPEIKPEVSGNVPPASSQWQRPEEKKVEIPKPPEVKKTEVSGRQVIDLTNFGLSKPDED